MDAQWTWQEVRFCRFIRLAASPADEFDLLALGWADLNLEVPLRGLQNIHQSNTSALFRGVPNWSLADNVGPQSRTGHTTFNSLSAQCIERSNCGA